jgi:3-deoxy-7-phosphoheptulonate synthase
MIEVHPDPDLARSDGAQSLAPDQFEELMTQVNPIAQAIHRRVTPPLVASTVGIG